MHFKRSSEELFFSAFCFSRNDTSGPEPPPTRKTTTVAHQSSAPAGGFKGFPGFADRLTSLFLENLHELSFSCVRIVAISQSTLRGKTFISKYLCQCVLEERTLDKKESQKSPKCVLVQVLLILHLFLYLSSKSYTPNPARLSSSGM